MRICVYTRSTGDDNNEDYCVDGKNTKEKEVNDAIQIKKNTHTRVMTKALLKAYDYKVVNYEYDLYDNKYI